MTVWRTLLEPVMNEHGFFHGRLIGGIGRILTGDPLGAIRHVITGGNGGPRSCDPGFKFVGGKCIPIRGQVPFPTSTDPFIRAAPCEDPQLIRDEFGRCVAPSSPLSMAGIPWQAVMGQYGAALVPVGDTRLTRKCPRGAVLGTDDLCYNKRDLRKDERKWPPGRQPLLTGGEMRAISIASAAAGKLDRKKKQLEKLGLLKRPVRRRTRALPSGHHAHVAHD